MNPTRSRYNGEIGDVIVGRVNQVSQKRWKIDLGARGDGILLLSSVNLSGGVQRRKTELDELSMRLFFDEGHVLVAEVHGFFQDGCASLHTRSTKYGKLKSGVLVIVSSALIKRSKSHFLVIDCLGEKISVVLGVNGFIWVSVYSEIEHVDDDDLYSNENLEISNQARMGIARIQQCIEILGKFDVCVSENTINDAIEASKEFSCGEMYGNQVAVSIVESVLLARAGRLVKDKVL